MPRAMFEDVIRFLRHTCAVGVECGLTDAQLLDRFQTEREETAFTFLVQRHGPMILGVGRRVLGDAHEAEDVLQATFLILARRTRAIGGKRSIGGWLHGVAHHVALKAKAKSTAQRKREREVRTMPSARPVDELTCQELRAALDDAIASLPEKYQAPVVLCYLEGKSYDQAAQELGCPKTTLARRLTQAREVLRKKLAHRGIGLTAAALATALADVAAASPLPAMLTIKTVKAAGLVVAGKSVAGCLTAGAIALAEEAMVVAKEKLVLMVMVVGLAVGGVGWAGYKTLAETSRAQPPPVSRDAQRSAESVPRRAIAVDQYGDPLPAGAIARFGTSRLRHGQYVRSVAFSPDGKEIASSSYDGIIRFWDPTTGKELRRFHKLFDSPGRIAYIANGQELAVVEGTWYDTQGRRQSRGIRVWDTATGKFIRSLEENIGTFSEARLVTFTPRGNDIAVVRGTSITVYDPTDSTRPTPSKKHVTVEVAGIREVTHVAISAGARRLSVGALLKGDGPINRDKQASVVRVYNLQTGKQVWERKGLTGNAAGMFPAADFSPDAKVIAVSFSHTEQMLLLDSETGTVVRRFTSPSIGFWPFHFTADGTKIYVNAWGGPGEIWDVNTGKPIGPWYGRDGHSFQLALSQDNKVMASAERRKIRLMAARNGKAVLSDDEPSAEVTSIQLHPDGDRLLSGSCFDGVSGFTVWNRKTSRRLFDYPKEASAFSLSPKGRNVALGYAFVLLDLEGNRVVRENPKKEIAFRWLTYSPDGSRIIGFDWSGNTVYQLDPSTLLSRPLIEGIHVDALAMFPEGNRIAVAASEERANENRQRFVNVDIWDLAGKRKVRSLTGLGGSYPLAVSVSGDGLLVAACSADSRFTYAGDAHDTRIFVWNANTGDVIATLPGSINGHRSLAFSPDGRTLAAGGEDHAAYLWELASATVRAKLLGHEGPVTAVAFVPDSHTLYTGSSDTTILAWDLMAPATESSDVSAAWARLTDSDGVKGHRAIRTLISAPASTIALLAQQLKKLPLPDDAAIKKLIVDLDSVNFNIREAASKELTQLGRVCIPLLRDAAQTKSLEMSLRANKLIRAMDPHQLTGDELRQVRAVEVLESIATPEARRLLEKLASGGRGDLLTEEAKRTLERLIKDESKKAL